jgi:secreted PhoX family phosphatase
MSQYERDYQDPSEAPGFEPGDEIPSNVSANPTFYDVIDQALATRRGFMAGGLAVMATGLFGNVLGGKAAMASSSALMGFKPIPVSMDDTVVVPEGYRWQVLGAWGEPILGEMPAYNPDNTAAHQAQQVGQHHDGMHYFPIEGSSEDGLLVLNHEYVEPRMLHAGKYAGMAMKTHDVLIADSKRDDDEVLKEIHAHGISVYRTRKGANGWEVVADPLNRRITGATPMEIAGPVRGSTHVRTKYSPDGTRTRGTLNNCAHGVTPWNTYMSAEENWAGYFVNQDKVDQKPDLPREHARYGVPSGERSRYGWELAASGADDFARFNASATGADATQDYRNEPNTFGWMIEVDPFDPNSTPVKRTHLGRFAHEGVVFAKAEAGKPIVCYSGDDARFEYIYKFVSAANYEPGVTKGDILDSGTLYAARFNADGTGEWLALAPGQNRLTPENGFGDLADILVNTRAAADTAGATKMDRPEWGAVDPVTGEVYFTLTNNTRRSLTQVDAANPRAENAFGSIIRWEEGEADIFTWDMFVLAGTQRQSKTFTNAALSDDSIFACPDGLWFDDAARLWIQTDMGDIGPDYSGALKSFGMNAMLCADPKTGEIRRFLTGPWGQEVTGVVTTPDGKSMFVNFQHPGAHASDAQFAAGDYGSSFPDGAGKVARSGTIVITREDGGVIGA